MQVKAEKLLVAFLYVVEGDIWITGRFWSYFWTTSALLRCAAISSLPRERLTVVENILKRMQLSLRFHTYAHSNSIRTEQSLSVIFKCKQ